MRNWFARLRAAILCISWSTLALPVASQEPGPKVEPFIAVDASVVALVGADLIDGTGAPANDDYSILIRDGRIAAVGPESQVEIPADAEVIELDGHTVLPGFVMVHEHMFYPAGGDGMYNQLGFSFPRLYLAGGATTVRTGGSLVPYADLNLARMIERWEIPGPDMDVTAPYLNPPGLGLPAVNGLRGPDHARQMVAYWADEGATSFKAYTTIRAEELRAVIDQAHARGLKVTGHLCSITFSEAAELGIDNLEHGFMAATDFVAGKKRDRCVDNRDSLLALDIEGEAFQSLVAHLVEDGVAVTSTMAVFETFAPGRPVARGVVLDSMATEPREDYLRRWSRIAEGDSHWDELFVKGMKMEKAFFDAGGFLIAGTDPSGYGGVVAGFSNQRVVELFVEGGFTIEEAVMISTLNGARYLERDKEVGSIEIGKRADLIVVEGSLGENVSAIRNVETVFKAGVGYDSAKLIEAASGTVGLR